MCEHGESQTPKPQTAVVEKQRSPFQSQPIPLEEPFTFNADSTLAFRIYPDNRPRNMEIASLQKGLVLMVDGSELIEEGAGFGVPIAKYSDTTFFSRTAYVYLQRQDENAVVITKAFLLDSISRKQVHSVFINDGFYSVFHKTFERAYLHRGNMRPFFDWVMELRKKLGVETRFIETPPKGKVIVTYQCYADQVKVDVDLSSMNTAGCREILMLNEQGATFFNKQKDSGGTVLSEREISGWRKIDADQAEFSDAEGHIAFSLKKKNGATLYCGREQVKDRFSWAGMTYALNPKVTRFSYNIKIDRN